MASTREVLVLASAAANVTRDAFARSIHIQNLGPNAIWCAINATAVVNKTVKILPGDSFAADATDKMKVSLIASTADQVTGAATIITEI